MDWGDGSPIEPAVLTGRPGSFIIDAEHDYTAAGNYTVEICVTDEVALAPDGGDGLTASKPPTDPQVVPITACDTATATVLAMLDTPDTLVGDDRSVDEGDVVAFGVGYADATRGAIHTVEVDWGDGSPVEPVAVQSDGSFGSGWGSHRYDDDGVYEVTVTTHSRWTPPVDGAQQQTRTSTGSSTITVGNLPPVVAAGRDRLTTGTVALETDSTYRDPGSADTHTAAIDWGDGSPAEAAGVQPDATEPGAGRITGSHTYAADGSYTATVTVTDDDGATGRDTFTVTVSQDAPPFTIDVPETVDGDEGSPIDLPVIVTVSPPAPDPIEAKAVPPEPVAVESGTGPPAISEPGVNAAGEPASSEPGVDAAAEIESASGSLDPGDVTASVSWGDGSGVEPFSLSDESGRLVGSSSHVYADDGTYTIVTTVCVPVPGAGGTSTDVCDTAVTRAPITNLDPVLDALEAAVAPGDGLDAVVTGTYRDPGSGDTHVAVVDWGDGSADESLALANGSLRASHRYNADGTYDIGVCVTDDDQGRDCRTTTLSVRQQTPATTTTTTITTTTTTSTTTTSSTTTSSTTTTVAPTTSTSAVVTSSGVDPSTVEPPATGPSSRSTTAPLPRTGSSISWTVVLGLALIVIGAWMIRLRRRLAHS